MSFARSVTSIPLAPSTDCAADCRPRALLERERLLGLEGEDGLPLCRRCLDAVRERSAADRIAEPLSPADAHRGAASAPVSRRWDEALTGLREALRPVAAGRRDLLWISTSPRPRLLDVLPRRIASVAPRVTHVRRVLPVETLARLVVAQVPAALRAEATHIAEADALVVWGADPCSGPAHVWLAVERALDSGARLLVIDPRGSDVARRAQSHVALRPGTDAALALALAGRGDDAWSLDRAAPITACAVEDLVAVRDLLRAAVRPAFLLGGGVARSASAPHTVAAIARCAMEFGARIAAPWPAVDPAGAVAVPLSSRPSRVVQAGLLVAELERLDPRATCVVVEGGDPLLQLPDRERLAQFVRRAEFVAVFASRWSEICESADLILPASSPLERAEAVALRDPPGLRFGEPLFPPPRGHIQEPAVWNRIARDLGWPEALFPPAAEQLRAAIKLDRLAASASAPVLQAEHLESGEGPLRTPALARAYRLFLVSAELAQPEGLDVGGHRRPIAVIAPADAGERGIDDGGRIVVHNERARVDALARIDRCQPRGVVTLPDRVRKRPQPAAAFAPPSEAQGPGEVWGPTLVEIGPEH